MDNNTSTTVAVIQAIPLTITALTSLLVALNQLRNKGKKEA
jgi:hypothetical protein